MDIGNNRTQRTKKEVVRNLFPQTARPPVRKVNEGNLFVNNPPVQQRISNRCPDGGASIMEGAQTVGDDIEEEQEQEFSLVQSPFRPSGLDERPEPARHQQPEDDAGFSIAQTRKNILEAIPVVDDGKPLARVQLRKSMSHQYTSAELSELGLDK